MKRTLLVIALLALCSLASAQSNDRLIIRIFEGLVDDNSRIIITQNGVTIETVSMKASHKSGIIEDNQKIIDLTLNKYLNDNYKIISSTSGGNQAIMITTYIVERE